MKPSMLSSAIAEIAAARLDLERATGGVLAGVFAASGQTCVAGSRLLAERPIYDELLERPRERASAIVICNPMCDETHMGPIATSEQLAKIRPMVGRARRDGATVITGGEDASVPAFPDGFFYMPTIVTDAPKCSEIAREEVFGPVLVARPFDDDSEALAIANDREYGLASGPWTRDVNRVHRFARSLAVGTVWVNTYRALTFNSPFGGYKASGFGRVNGVEAVDEFLADKERLDRDVRRRARSVRPQGVGLCARSTHKSPLRRRRKA